MSSNWRKVRLDQCAEIVSGATPSTAVESYWNGNVCWATPKDLSDLEGAYISDTPRKLTPAGLENCAAAILPVGSVLFSSRAPIGHVAVNTVPMATNQGFKSFVPNRQRVDGKFLYWWLCTNRSYLETLGNGATFKEVSKAIVSRIEIPLPPLSEQRRIAELLDRAEALRAKRRAALTQLDFLTQTLFLDPFSRGKTRFPVVKLSEVCEEDSPITYGILQPGPDIPDGVPYVRPSEIKEGQIKLSAIRRTTPAIANKYKKSVLRAGDILITIVGTIGSVAIIPAELEGGNITQSSARVRVSPVKADRRFVEHFLRSHLAKRQYDQHRLGVAVERLNLHHVRDLELPLPPIELQREFGLRVKAVEKLKTAQRTSLAELDALFATLQHRAFRGEL